MMKNKKSFMFGIKTNSKLKSKPFFNPFRLKPISKPRYVNQVRLAMPVHSKVIPKVPYKRTLAEKKLIRKSPWGDKDGDGVPNWIDCKPFDRRRQGKRKDIMTPRQKITIDGKIPITYAVAIKKAPIGKRFQLAHNLEWINITPELKKMVQEDLEKDKNKNMVPDKFEKEYTSYDSGPWPDENSKKNQWSGDIARSRSREIDVLEDYGINKKKGKRRFKVINRIKHKKYNNEFRRREEEEDRRSDYGLDDNGDGNYSTIMKENKKKGIALIKHYDSYSPASESSDVFEIRKRGKDEPLWSSGIGYTAEYIGENVPLDEAKKSEADYAREKFKEYDEGDDD